MSSEKQKLPAKRSQYWTTSLADYFFRTKVLRQKPPLIASFKITYRCNLKCDGCPFHLLAGRGQNASLTVAVPDKALRL